MSESANAEVTRRELQQEIERLRAQVDATERRLRATHAVSRVLGEETSLELAAPRLLAALASALGCSLASFWFPEGDRLVARASWAADDVKIPWHDACRQSTFAAGEGLPGRVWRERGPVWVSELGAECIHRKALLGADSIQTGIGFPIQAGNDVLGVIDLFSRTRQPADDQLVEVLRATGGHLGQFIKMVQGGEQLAREIAQSHVTAAELEHERETLAKLNEIVHRLAGELDTAALVQAVTDVATELTGAEFGAFFYTVIDERGENEMQYSVAGLDKETFARLPMPRSTSLLGNVLNGRSSLRLDDVTADARFGKTPPYHGLPPGHVAVKSFLAVPVTSRAGRPIGALMFGHSRPGVFTERAHRLAISLATHAASAMDNARLFTDAQRLIRELEKTNLELDQFAYAASHDLRAPLRGITNLATWIEEDLGAHTPKKVREHLTMLRGRAQRMDKLINGLLELARVGRTRNRPERVDVAELLHETIDLLSPPESSRILVIGAMPTLTAERFALQQVFLNLIGNAVQHAGRKDVVVRVSCEDMGDDYEWCIADNGVGIAVEHHERVWQIFQTLSSRDVVESTGIGLTIVRKQVEGHGGQAWIDPQVKDGASFRFSWPKRPTRDK
jgi:signal transduction histidine kinase